MELCILGIEFVLCCEKLCFFAFSGCIRAKLYLRSDNSNAYEYEKKVNGKANDFERPFGSVVFFPSLSLFVFFFCFFELLPGNVQRSDACVYVSPCIVKYRSVSRREHRKLNEKKSSANELIVDVQFEKIFQQTNSFFANDA